MRHIRTLALAALALAVALPASAQQAAAPEPLVVTAENRTAAAEAARGVPRTDAVAARPGDVVRYRLTFRNPGGERIRGVRLDNPVAAGMQYVGGSARSSRDDVRAEFSADGGATWSERPTEEVVEDGRRVRRAVPAERYTHVRWTIDGWVAPGTTVTAEFDARLGPGRPAAAPASGR